ncbi:LysR family transcriptional regulator [Rubrimonas cliftonensis]|uniref:Transcriptional regulator, LysR family n=1 Tax=Rubrimonas cliftonensis TaxID=89524 RepID=A0A1H4BWS6_9RHOB|nr:LysR family transcriptional regulator [Rubrimonas cliftonensis]SEA52576.1 transcriptional regulator, LysR family [Rubrimonas cliftonensis]
MPRNLDIAALRSFVTAADLGGVTRAAGQLNLTQSAVSMQIKRLEGTLGQTLLDRSGRGVTLTAHGEHLLSYARRMLALNDEALTRMTGEAFEGELRLGAPHDVIHPRIPAVLGAFSRSHPRVRVSLVSEYSRRLKEMLAAGAVDVALTTERSVDAGGETLDLSPLVWCGAAGGDGWRRRPLPLAYSRNCIFRPIVQAALEAAGVDWTMSIETDCSRAREASVAADLAVYALMGGEPVPPGVERIDHGGALPDLGEMRVNLYLGEGPKAALAERLAAGLREAFAQPRARAAAASSAAAA